jgi:ATP-binding cassette subfamily B protein RaxB
MPSTLQLQSEAAECGLASLAMVASHHGHHVSLAEMRRRFPLSLKGAKLNQLIAIAQQIGFSTRPLRLDMEDLGKLRLPCVLHWDLSHFVVLTKVGPSKATILDPAIGERTLSLGEVSEHFTGVALELAPAVEFKPRKAAPAVSARQLTGPVRGLWRALAQILGLSLALQVFVILAPFCMQGVGDEAVASAIQALVPAMGLGDGLAL